MTKFSSKKSPYKNINDRDKRVKNILENIMTKHNEMKQKLNRLKKEKEKQDRK